MSHDASIYSNPFDVKPERFLPESGKSAELDPQLLAFGFGRR